MILDKHEQLKSQLVAACDELQITLEMAKIDALMAYLALLMKWNKAYNLSSIRDAEGMLFKHIIDSLSVLPHIHGRRFIDVGTGPGLPGIVLAICCPENQYVLLDSNTKKTRFLFQAKTQLNLTNVTIESHRVELYQPTQLFDGVISRAFTALDNMIKLCGHLLIDGGCFYAMKGAVLPDELAKMPVGYDLVALPLQVPGDIGERHLMMIKPE